MIQMIWDKLFNNGPNKFLKGCLPQILLGPPLNTLSCLIAENQITDNCECEKLLGVKFDYKLTFNSHDD